MKHLVPPSVAIGGLSSSGQTSIIEKPISATSLPNPNPRRGRAIYPAQHFRDAGLRQTARRAQSGAHANPGRSSATRRRSYYPSSLAWPSTEEPIEAAAERGLTGLETRGKRREQSCLHR